MANWTDLRELSLISEFLSNDEDLLKVKFYNFRIDPIEPLNSMSFKRI